ncbi:MAG: hypothetical protein ACYS14_04210, partial [Planctomycetota bacterium]
NLIGPVVEEFFVHDGHYIAMPATCQCHLVNFSKILLDTNLPNQFHPTTVRTSPFLKLATNEHG